MPPVEKPKVTPFDDPTPSEEMLDPGKKQLDHMKAGVTGMLNKIREEEDVRKRREHETAKLDEEKAEEKKASKIRQGKFEAIMKEQAQDEDRKVMASEEQKLQEAEKKATESKPPSIVETNWDLKVDKAKNEITAQEIASELPEKELYFDRYTESLDAHDAEKHKHLQAMLRARKESSQNCAPCKEKCKTDACMDWCEMRYCVQGAAYVDTGPELESQEAITASSNERAVNPGKEIMCAKCADPSTEAERSWCVSNGCVKDGGESNEDNVAPDAATPSDA